MAVIGFNLKKIHAERGDGSAKSSIEVRHNVIVDSVSKTEFGISGPKIPVLKIDFTFEVLYSNSIGSLGISGDTLYSDTKEIIEEVFKGWEKDKNLNMIAKEPVHKFVYSKALIKAIEFADIVSLPSPIPMPKVEFKKNNKKK